jgi:hypothetical protein
MSEELFTSSIPSTVKRSCYSLASHREFAILRRDTIASAVASKRKSAPKCATIAAEATCFVTSNNTSGANVTVNGFSTWSTNDAPDDISSAVTKSASDTTLVLDVTSAAPKNCAHYNSNASNTSDKSARSTFNANIRSQCDIGDAPGSSGTRNADPHHFNSSSESTSTGDVNFSSDSPENSASVNEANATTTASCPYDNGRPSSAYAPAATGSIAGETPAHSTLWKFSDASLIASVFASKSKSVLRSSTTGDATGLVAGLTGTQNNIIRSKLTGPKTYWVKTGRVKPVATNPIAKLTDVECKSVLQFIIGFLN